MAKLAITMLIIGVCTLILYGVYSLFRVIYDEEGVSLVVKVVFPIIITGITLLLLVVIRDRVRDRRRERFKEVDF